MSRGLWLFPFVARKGATGVESVSAAARTSIGDFLSSFRALIEAVGEKDKRGDGSGRERVLEAAWNVAEKEADLQRVRWSCELLTKVYTAGEGKALQEAATKAATDIASSVQRQGSAPAEEAIAWKNAAESVISLCDEEIANEGEEESVKVLDQMALRHTFKRWHTVLSVVPEDCDRERLSVIDTTVAELRSKFCSRANSDTSTVTLPRSALAGMSEAFLSSLQVSPDDSSHVVVTSKYPDALPVVRSCDNSDTRRRVLEMFRNRAPGNTEILRELILLLQERSSLVGARSYAHTVLADNRMAKTPERVAEFLDDLTERLKPAAEKDRAELSLLKEREEGGSLEAWDVSYYSEKYKQEKFQLNTEELRAWFPLDHVLDVVLTLYQRIFGLEFVRLKTVVGDGFDDRLWSNDPSGVMQSEESLRDGPEETVLTWHDDVLAFRVYEEVEVKDNATEVVETRRQAAGFFLLDLFPRPGKYGHACAYPVIDGLIKRGTEHSWQVEPVATMVANIPASGGLRVNEVKTLFHEMGHVLHALCARPRTWSQGWFNVPLDFVEAPSQALEYFAWDATFLKRLTKHRETGEPLDDDTIARLVSSKNSLSSLDLLRQIAATRFDQRIHSNPDDDERLAKANLDPKRPLFEEGTADKATEAEGIARLYEEMVCDATGVPEMRGDYPAAWLHLATSEYAASYYGYLYSEVLSADIFHTIATGGPTSLEDGGASDGLAAAAQRYRSLVLAPGAATPPDVMLRTFLGREPNQDAFLRSLGITP